MTATYKVETNSTWNSREVFFDGKPCEAVREALKGLKMRWNGKRSCWYGFASSDAIIAAINEATPNVETGGTVSDGYLGAVRWDGVKSHQHLYGADLSAAIRKDLKTAGVKGASVSVKSYTGGQSITVRVKLSADDFISEDEFVSEYRIKGNQYWIETGEPGGSIHCDKFWAASATEQEKIRVAAARYAYKRATTTEYDCYRASRAVAVNQKAAARLALIQDIVESYNYDDSNGMVDYFDTNFYWSMELIPV
jgi:hypothetical protein